MVRKIKAKLVLQFRNQGLSGRAISSAQGMSRHSVQAVIDAADRAGLGWDAVAEMSDGEVYLALFPGRGVRESVLMQPDWGQVHRELARVGVTLKLLHQEYVDASGRAGQAAMSSDRFCRLYGDHAMVTGASSRVGHKAGRSIEVDWSGPTMQLVDPATGEISKVYLFVACLPFSRYAFVEACLEMRQDSWLRAHAEMFAFFGGTVPRLVPDYVPRNIIRHDDLRDAAGERERPQVRVKPRLGLHVHRRVTEHRPRERQHSDEQICALGLTGDRIDNVDRVAGPIDQHRPPGLVSQSGDKIIHPQVLPEKMAVLRVAILLPCPPAPTYFRQACCSVKYRLAFIDLSTASKSGDSYSSDTRLRPSGNIA